jgi:hypothetical protein
MFEDLRDAGGFYALFDIIATCLCIAWLLITFINLVTGKDCYPSYVSYIPAIVGWFSHLTGLILWSLIVRSTSGDCEDITSIEDRELVCMT